MANQQTTTLNTILKQLAERQAAEVAHAVSAFLAGILGSEPSASPEVPKPRGRPPGVPLVPRVPRVPRVNEAATVSASPAKPKRSWPVCSVKGCGGKFFPSSGVARRLCYKHFLEAGGKPPLLAANRSKKAASSAKATAGQTTPKAPAAKGKKARSDRSYGDAEINKTLALITSKPGLKAAEIFKQAGLGARTGTKVIAHLRGNGAIKATGAGRWTTYSAR